MRKKYREANTPFLEDDIEVKDPIVLFGKWFEAAKQCGDIYEPNAMCLATATT